MRLRISFLIISTIALRSCASTQLKNYWPYSQIMPNKVQALVPKTYEDCLPAIDKILSEVAKRHFKNQDSSIAVIELCEEIGGFFTTNWRLYRYNEQYHWPLERNVILPKKPLNIASQFIADGIYHPKAMIRVMFTCYYKYLNGQEYDWHHEINKMKILWPEENPTNFSGELPEEIAVTEKNKISKYQFDLLSELDTVNILFNRPPKISKKSSDWYYITGIVNSKIQDTKSINITIIDIESEFTQKYMPRKNDTLKIGDTITEYHKGWLSRSKFYFNYHKCVEARKAFNFN
jgi:hypothetical protein